MTTDTAALVRQMREALRQMSNEQPEAIRLAEWSEWFLKNVRDPMDFRWVRMAAMCAELRRQHAEIQRLHEERFREVAEQQLEIERLRGCLLWLLWHHQGASSPTGQPIRRALGIDKHAPMTEAQIEAGQRFGVGAACATAWGVKLEGDAE